MIYLSISSVIGLLHLFEGEIDYGLLISFVGYPGSIQHFTTQGLCAGMSWNSQGQRER